LKYNVPFYTFGCIFGEDVRWYSVATVFQPFTSNLRNAWRELNIL